MNRDATCRTFEVDLTAYHQGELPPGRQAEISAHVAECEACAEFLAGIRSVFGMAGAIEDLSPSLRLRRNLERMIRRARRPVERPAGLQWRIRTAAAFLVHRFRTSPRFKLAALSVGFHAILLLAVSLIVLPGIVEEPRDPSVEILPDVVTLGDDVSPPTDTVRGPVAVEDPVREPGVSERPPSPAPPRPHLGLPHSPILPPAEKVVYHRPRAIFARILDPEIRRERLAALVEEPEAVVRSVDRALRWLADQQREDGSWAAPESHASYGTGVTAVALMAFLADGNGVTRGPKDYRRVVRLAIDRLLADQAKGGDLAGLIGPANGHYTYNHALATQALIEAYCIDFRRVPVPYADRLKTAIRAGLALIERSQSSEGGWRYEYRFAPPWSNDTSVSLFQVMALAAARSAGFRVKEDVFTGFARWLRSVTGEDGVVSYQERGSWNRKPRTLTAGALFLSELLGLARPLRARQAAEVRRELEDPHGPAPKNGLLRFYAALAFDLRGEAVPDSFLPEMLRAQTEAGSWRSGGDEHARFGGDAFLTALNVLTITTCY